MAIRVRIHGYACAYVCVHAGLLAVFFFLHHPRAPGITLHHGRDAFSNRWWPTVALFSPSLTLPASVFLVVFFRSLFLSFFFLQVHPLSTVLLLHRCPIHFPRAVDEPREWPVRALFFT